MQLTVVNIQLHVRPLIVNYLIINSLDLSLVYLQLQLEKLSLTHLTELNYFTNFIIALPTLLQLRITQLQLSQPACPTNQPLNSKIL